MSKNSTSTIKRVRNIERKYGVNLGVRSDMKLNTYLKKKGYKSLAKMAEK